MCRPQPWARQRRSAAVARAGLEPAQIDETIFGSARQAGIGPNIARQIAWRCGVPVEQTAFTVNKACASGLKAITLGIQSIMTGENEIVLAGGVEQMSQVPYLLLKARWGYRLGNESLVDANYRDGYDCPLSGMVMGETVDRLVEQYGITQHQQDRYAAESHRKAIAAWEDGAFDAEVVPVEIAGRKGEKTLVTRDERPRADTDERALSRLATVFRPAAEGGTVTAANASGIADGAAAVVHDVGRARRSVGRDPAGNNRGLCQRGCGPDADGAGANAGDA